MYILFFKCPQIVRLTMVKNSNNLITDHSNYIILKIIMD